MIARRILGFIVSRVEVKGTLHPYVLKRSLSYLKAEEIDEATEQDPNFQKIPHVNITIDEDGQFLLIHCVRHYLH